VLDLERGPSVAELAKVKPQLSAAHDAQARADRFMAEKERLLIEKDPKRTKAILVAGRETVIDIERGIARDLHSGQEEKLHIAQVVTRSHGQEEEQANLPPISLFSEIILTGGSASSISP
jgi:hypothetical protein